jgi:hypothetical protein
MSKQLDMVKLTGTFFHFTGNTKQTFFLHQDKCKHFLNHSIIFTHSLTLMCTNYIHTANRNFKCHCLPDYQIHHYSELFLEVNHSYDEYLGELSISKNIKMKQNEQIIF